MTASLHNIGTPRALGHAVARAKTPYSNPYPRQSDEAKAFTTGFFEGDEQNYHGNVIIAPDLPEENPPRTA